MTRTGAICGLVVVGLFVMPSITRGQSKRSKSDKDINAIGHRNIARGPDMYSLEREKQLGERLVEQVAKSSRFVTDPEILKYLEIVDQNVERNSDKHLPMTLHLIDSDTISSYTLPAGQFFVTRGLLLHMESEGELASMLARGIATTALRPDTRIATELNIMQIASTPLVPTLPANSADGNSMALGLTWLKLRRDAEFDTDYFGIQYLYESGYDPKCFAEFVRQIGETVKPAPVEMSPYPPLPERLRALQDEIAHILPNRNGAIVNTPEFQQFKNRLGTMKSEDVASKNSASN